MDTDVVKLFLADGRADPTADNNYAMRKACVRTRDIDGTIHRNNDRYYRTVLVLLADERVQVESIK